MSFAKVLSVQHAIQSSTQTRVQHTIQTALSCTIQHSIQSRLNSVLKWRAQPVQPWAFSTGFSWAEQGPWAVVNEATKYACSIAQDWITKLNHKALAAQTDGVCVCGNDRKCADIPELSFLQIERLKCNNNEYEYEYAHNLKAQIERRQSRNKTRQLDAQHTTPQPKT